MSIDDGVRSSSPAPLSHGLIPSSSKQVHPWSAPAKNYLMDLNTWVAQRNGIVHRHAALRFGFSVNDIRRAKAAGDVTVLRRRWLVTSGADSALVNAAEHGNRLTCVSVAVRRGWWVPEGTASQIHLAIAPNGHGAPHGVCHWGVPITPRGPETLVESPLDALRRIASCLPMDDALAIWESAIHHESLDPSSLRITRWRSASAAKLASECRGLSDSGLETFLVTRMARHGVRVRQQVWIAGHPVDGLIGDWLVVQTDGHEFHSDPIARARDAAHDAELTLRGYTVLRGQAPGRGVAVGDPSAVGSG